MVYYDKTRKTSIYDPDPIIIRPGGWAAIYPKGVIPGDQVIVRYWGKYREATVLGTNKKQTKIKVSVVMPRRAQPQTVWVDVVTMRPGQSDQLMDRVLGPMNQEEKLP